MPFRSHFCGTLSQSDEGANVYLAGWVDVRRDLGGLIFIELRDHTGRVQLVSDPKVNRKFCRYKLSRLSKISIHKN